MKRANDYNLVKENMESQQIYFKCTGQDSQQKKHRLSEKDVLYQFTVKGSIAYHHLKLTYINKKNLKSLKFAFLLTEDTCFDHLSIKIGEEIINCKLKEKEEAKNQYEKAIKEGKQAALGQIEEGRGYFSVDIGNVQKCQDYLIDFKYIEQLNLCGQDYLMSLPFDSFSAYALYKDNIKKLTLKGDIFTQSKDDEILESKFLNLVQSSSITTTNITKSHTQITGSFENLKVLLIGLGQLMIRYDKLHMSLLSSFQNDSEISPYCALYNFVPHVISVKNSLQTFFKNNDQKSFNLIKSEFILLIDRSGSMSGSRIETAKESLVFFLKSLPIGSIYNIISFGSTYEMMYNCSVQLNDTNLQESINLIQEFDADMGGTEISESLTFLFKNLQDQYGLRKKLYILTDGEFIDGSQVRQNQNRCDINVLCIGSGSNFQTAEDIAKATKGYTCTVKHSSDIVSKVIQLLSNSFKNYDSITMNLSSDHDECINYIVPNPESIQYIDTTKTLRFYIFFNRKFEEANQIKFKLTTTYKGNKNIQDNFVIDLKSQIPNEQAHLHKMGLYQLIRQLTINQKRKSESITDDITKAIKMSQHKMKELFKNEAIRYQILCEYTAFVGVSSQKIENPSQTTNNNDFLNQQTQVYYRSILAQNQAPNGSKRKTSRICINPYPDYQSTQNSCCGGGGSSTNNNNNSQKTFLGKQYSKLKNINSQNEKSNNQESPYNKVIYKQSVNGIWQYSAEVITLLNLTEQDIQKLNPIDKAIPKHQDLWMTIIVAYWLQKFFQDRANQHQYVLLKAHGEKDKELKKYSIKDPQKELQELFKGYALNKI